MAQQFRIVIYQLVSLAQVKDNISQTGTNTTVKGQHGLYELYQEAIDFKNHLALHKNDNMRFNILVTSVENVIHTIARYQEEVQVNLDLPSSSLINKIMPYSVRSKISPRPISVELLVLKFIQVPEVEIHIQSDDDEFKTVIGRETAKPHLNNPNGSKIGRLERATPGDLVYLPVMTRCDLNRLFSVRPILTSDMLKLTPTTEKEKKTWQKFEQETLETEVTPGTLVDKEKRSIALDHPIVSDIGNFAVFTYNKACNMHVKMVEHNLHDIEFMECKYNKVGQMYHFYVTIEAIEEGNLGIYEAEVLCASVGYSRSLYKFNLTNRKPFDLFNERMTRLKFLCEALTGGEGWAVFGETQRLRKLHLETLKGLRKKLYQDAHSLFPPDCDRTTNPGDWHDPSDVPSSGMVPRAKDSTCSGYDYYPYGWIIFMPVQADNGADKGAVVERERPRATRNNNHRKKTYTDACTGSFTESDGTLNDADPLKEVVSLSVIDELMAMELETPLVKSSYDNVIGESSKKAMKTVNIRTLFTPRGNGIDVVVPVESIRAISERFVNTAYGFFLSKRVAYPVVANYVRNSWEDVGNVLVWVKLHNVPVIAFCEDCLSAIAMRLGTPLMLNSYTFDMCLQSWGRSSYDRVMIELRADVELKDNIVVVMPKIMGR
ncbi:hypothetical protein Tco_0578471, partial [Tanacetum coccineum]